MNIKCKKFDHLRKINYQTFHDEINEIKNSSNEIKQNPLQTMWASCNPSNKVQSCSQLWPCRSLMTWIGSHLSNLTKRQCSNHRMRFSPACARPTSHRSKSLWSKTWSSERHTWSWLSRQTVHRKINTAIKKWNDKSSNKAMFES